MDKKNFNQSKLIIAYRGLPIRKKIIAGIIGFFALAFAIFYNLNVISVVFVRGQEIHLINFTSQDQSYQIKIPKGWMPYESLEGIRGDPNLIIQGSEGSFFQPTIEIARIETYGNSLSQVLDWGQDRAKQFPKVVINSINPFNTTLYKGTLLIYTIPEAGYQKRLAECHAWITYNEPYSYFITLCGIPKDWKRLDKPFQEIIESFTINNEKYGLLIPSFASVLSSP
jgi:hypothetical protein